MGSYFSGRTARFAPERPGFESRRVHFLVFGSVAQLDESTRLRTVRSQVRVLPEPLLSCPCSSVDESARFRTVRSQVQFLPGVLVASVAQWIKSGRVLSARSQVRILPGAHCNVYCGEGPGAPPGLIRLSHRVQLPAPQLLMHAEPAGDGVGPTHRFRWVRSPGRALSSRSSPIGRGARMRVWRMRVRLPLPALQERRSSRQGRVRATFRLRPRGPIWERRLAQTQLRCEFELSPRT